MSNEIVAILDFFPTLARAAGGTMPTDRPIDGVDQLDFFTGEREASNREHVLLFLGQRLMAVKWRHYKIHLDGLERVDGVIEDWSFPRAFNLASDPKEHHLAELVDRRRDRRLHRRVRSQRAAVPQCRERSAQ